MDAVEAFTAEAFGGQVRSRRVRGFNPTPERCGTFRGCPSLMRWAGRTGRTEQSHVADLFQLELRMRLAAGEHLAGHAQHAVITDFKNGHRYGSKLTGRVLPPHY